MPVSTRKSRAPAAKLKIINLDQGGTVEARFNPKEVGIDKSVPWQTVPTAVGDQPELTLTFGDILFHDKHMHSLCANAMKPESILE